MKVFAAPRAIPWLASDEDDAARQRHVVINGHLDVPLFRSAGLVLAGHIRSGVLLGRVGEHHTEPPLVDIGGVPHRLDFGLPDLYGPLDRDAVDGRDLAVGMLLNPASVVDWDGNLRPVVSVLILTGEAVVRAHLLGQHGPGGFDDAVAADLPGITFQSEPTVLGGGEAGGSSHPGVPSVKYAGPPPRATIRYRGDDDPWRP